MDPLIKKAKQRLDKILEVIKNDFATIRAGRAVPALVENIVISAYGGSARLKVMELATVVATDLQTLVLTPFDPSIIHEIQKGIEATNMGLTPAVDGNVIRIKIPQLSQERREELIKAMHQKQENGRIMVRQVRHEVYTEIKKEFEGVEDDIKRLEKEVQRLVDDMMDEIEKMGEQKEKELLQI